MKREWVLLLLCVVFISHVAEKAVGDDLEHLDVKIPKAYEKILKSELGEVNVGEMTRGQRKTLEVLAKDAKKTKKALIASLGGLLGSTVAGNIARSIGRRRRQALGEGDPSTNVMAAARQTVSPTAATLGLLATAGLITSMVFVIKSARNMKKTRRKFVDLAQMVKRHREEEQAAAEFVEDTSPAEPKEGSADKLNDLQLLGKGA